MKHEEKQALQRTAVKYVVGFVASIFLTVVAYAGSMGYLGEVKSLVVFLLVLALCQFVVQIVFFLHLGDGAHPRLKRAALWFMGIILTIIVAGSVWIMYHLNYNMVHFSPTQKETYMLQQYNKGY